MEKKEVSFKGTLEREKAISYLEEMVASLKQGKLVVQQGEGYVTLNPSDMISLELSASKKPDKGKEKFVLELSWRQGQSLQSNPELKISSSEPVVEDENLEFEEDAEEDASKSESEENSTL